MTQHIVPPIADEEVFNDCREQETALVTEHTADLMRCRLAMIGEALSELASMAYRRDTTTAMIVKCCERVSLEVGRLKKWNSALRPEEQTILSHHGEFVGYLYRCGITPNWLHAVK